LNLFLVTSALIFAIGIYGILTRRQAIMVFLSVELLLNAANLALVGLSSTLADASAQAVAFLVIAIAAAEVAVGLGIIVAIFRLKDSASVDAAHELKG
jgi:NADH-quinone oxidoreductase subunit K